MVNDATSRPTGTPIDVDTLIDTLGYRPDEYIQLGNILRHPLEGSGRQVGAFRSLSPVRAAELPRSKYARDVNLTALCWYYGVNPVVPDYLARRPPLIDKRGNPVPHTYGRADKHEITRLAGLVADIDIEPGKCPDLATAMGLIAEISALIGHAPSLILHSGGGLQVIWTIEDADIGEDFTTADANTLLARWGELVAGTARRFGVKVDTVFDGARLMRCPGTVNNKQDQPRPVQVLATDGTPLNLAELRDRLDEYVPERDHHRLRGAHPGSGRVRSEPGAWQWAEKTCNYAVKLIDEWAKDAGTDPGGRHPALLNMLTRLSVMHRIGCLTQAEHQRGLDVIVMTFNAWISARPRPVPDGEIDSAHDWAVHQAARKDRAEVATEVGNHKHGQKHAVNGDPAVRPPRDVAVVERVTDDAPPISLAQAEETFRRWLGDGFDMDSLRAVVAALAAHDIEGIPVWLLIVSGSGNTKTELVNAVRGAGAVAVSTLTGQAALMSATKESETDDESTGGLLRRIGDDGILAVKDVTSILSMNTDRRREVLAALREVYDGEWVREAGVDGGRALTWRGRVSLVGAVTTAWDTHHSVIASLGDRFVLVRTDSADPKRRRLVGEQSIRNTGRETEQADELRAALAGVINGARAADPPVLTDAAVDALLTAADLVTRARTGVDRDPAGRVVDAHAPEAPTRFTKQLVGLTRGAMAAGMTQEEAVGLALRCARDSVPPLRLRLLRLLDGRRYAHPDGSGDSVAYLAQELGVPWTTVDREVTALFVLRLAERDWQAKPPGATGDAGGRATYRIADDVDIRPLGEGG